ncbi:MAG: PIN domain-containing protein [Isosphaeraceae bacterium]
MSFYVRDTDIFSLYGRGDPKLDERIDSHPLESLAITVITVEEEVAGWYSLLRKARDADEQVRAYERLAGAIPVLARWCILPMSHPALARYESLRRMNLNVRKMDLRIAAIVLENGATLVSRNLRDFRRIPGLVVEDWTT